MTLTINVFTALLIALGVSVGAFVVGGRQEERAKHALTSAEQALASVPSSEARHRLSRQADDLAESLRPVLRILTQEVSSLHHALLRGTAIRLAMGLHLLPLAGSVLALGFLYGLLRRDRARELVAYRSVTFSYLGKTLVLGGMAFGVFVAVCPFAPPVWSLFVSNGIAGLGAAIYVGNLPPRL